MEAWRLPLSPSIRGKLISAGYTCLSSIASVSSSDLARGKFLLYPNLRRLESVARFSLISTDSTPQLISPWVDN